MDKTFKVKPGEEIRLRRSGTGKAGAHGKTDDAAGSFVDGDEDGDDELYLFSSSGITFYDLGARLKVTGDQLEYDEVFFEAQVPIDNPASFSMYNAFANVPKKMSAADLALYNALWLKHFTDPTEDAFNPLESSAVPPNGRRVSNVLQLTKPMTRYMYGMTVMVNDNEATKKRLHERLDDDALIFTPIDELLPPKNFATINPDWTPTPPDTDWQERKTNAADDAEQWLAQNKDDQLVMHEGTLKQKKLKGNVKFTGGGHYYNFNTADKVNYRITRLPHFDAPEVANFKLKRTQLKMYLVPYLRFWAFGLGYQFNFHAAYTDHEIVDLVSSAQFTLGWILMRLPINPFIGVWQAWGLSMSSGYPTLECQAQYPWTLVLDYRAWKAAKIQANKMTKLHSRAVGLYFLNAVATVPDVPANWLFDHWPTEAEAQNIIQNVGYMGSGFYDHVGPRFFFPIDLDCMARIGEESYFAKHYPGEIVQSQVQSGLLLAILVQEGARYYVWRKTDDAANLDSQDWGTNTGPQQYAFALEPTDKPSDMP